MGDSVASFKAGAAPIDGAGAAGGSAPAGSSPARATSVADVIQLMTAPTRLSKEGEAYIGQIVDTLTRSGREPKVTTIMGSCYEARVLEHNNYVVAFLFTETYVPGEPPRPAASMSEDLRRRFVANGISGEPALFLVVTKEDYAKVDIMASLIVNAYKCNDTPAVRNFTAAGLDDSHTQYGLTDDMNVIKPFVERNCPFATLPRMDLGVMLYIKNPIKDDIGFQNSRQEFERVPVVAVTGFVDFVYADVNTNGLTGGGIKFNPIFVITGFYSPIVDVSMAAVGIPLTVYLEIEQGLWGKQFSVFKKGKPNIGNLLADQTTGAPIEVTSPEDRNKVIANHLTTPYPYVAIDLQLGRFVIPGLSKMVVNSAEFNQRIDQFTGGDGASRAGVAVQLTTAHFDGRYRASKTGEYLDTRCIDYLSLVAAGYQQRDVASFLRSMKSPEMRSNDIAKVNPDAEFLYVTLRNYLNPQFVTNVAADMQRVLRVRVDSVMDIGAYNIGALNGFSSVNIGNMPSFAVASSIGGFNNGLLW